MSDGKVLWEWSVSYYDVKVKSLLFEQKTNKRIPSIQKNASKCVKPVLSSAASRGFPMHFRQATDSGCSKIGLSVSEKAC